MYGGSPRRVTQPLSARTARRRSGTVRSLWKTVITNYVNDGQGKMYPTALLRIATQTVVSSHDLEVVKLIIEVRTMVQIKKHWNTNNKKEREHS